MVGHHGQGPRAYPAAFPVLWGERHLSAQAPGHGIWYQKIYRMIEGRPLVKLRRLLVGGGRL
jgi:hypothetical protein